MVNARTSTPELRPQLNLASALVLSFTNNTPPAWLKTNDRWQMHGFCNLGRAKKLFTSRVSHRALQDCAARQQISTSAWRKVRFQVVDRRDTTGGSHEIVDENNETLKTKWRRYELKDGTSGLVHKRLQLPDSTGSKVEAQLVGTRDVTGGSSGRNTEVREVKLRKYSSKDETRNVFVDNGTSTSETREGREGRAAKGARKAAQQKYLENVLKEDRAQKAHTPKAGLVRHTAIQKTFIRRHGAKEKDPRIFEMPTGHGTDVTANNELKREVRLRFVSSAPSSPPPPGPEASQRSEVHVVRAPRNPVRTHIAREKLLIRRYKDMRRELTPWTKRRQTKLRLIKVPLLVKRVQTDGRVIKGYGAFMRSHSASRPKNQRESPWEGVVQRSMRSQRDDKRYLRPKTRNTSSPKNHLRYFERRQRESRRLKTLTDSFTKSASKLDSLTEEERKDKLQMETLQDAIDDLTYAPPRKPVTFMDRRMRRRTFNAALRRQPRVDAMIEDSNMVHRPKE